MIEYRVTESISAVTRDRWDALFPDQLERFDYLAATESAGLPGFQWCYVIAEEEGQLLAATTAFLVDYALDTTLIGALKKCVGALRRYWPGLMTLRLGCLGSPCTEAMVVGFAPDVEGRSRAPIMSGLLQAFERHALAKRCNLLALKDVPADQDDSWRRITWPHGYRAFRGLPGAALEIDFTDMEQYLSRLSQGTRRDMRRKLRSRAAVRVECRRNIDDVLTSCMQLYAATRERADMQLEELTPAFFQGVLARVPGATCVLYYVNDRLLAMNLLLEDRVTLLDKFFCMNAEAGRDHNLYFLSWFRNVEYCLSRGLKRYLSGQAGYANKLRLGSTLCGRSMYFRHRNALVNQVLRIVAPLFTRSLDPRYGS